MAFQVEYSRMTVSQLLGKYQLFLNRQCISLPVSYTKMLVRIKIIDGNDQTAPQLRLACTVHQGIFVCV